MSITVTVADVRRLYNSDHREALLYVDLDEGTGKPTGLDVGFEGAVGHHCIIITRPDLVDWLKDDATDEDIAEYLSELQDTVDEVVENVSV